MTILNLFILKYICKNNMHCKRNFFGHIFKMSFIRFCKSFAKIVHGIFLANFLFLDLLWITKKNNNILYKQLYSGYDSWIESIVYKHACDSLWVFLKYLWSKWLKNTSSSVELFISCLCTRSSMFFWVVLSSLFVI